MRLLPPVGAALRPSGRGDDAVGNPHRAQVSHFALFELILSMKLDKQLPVERFESIVSQSAVPSPPLKMSLTLVLVNACCRHRLGPASSETLIRCATYEGNSELLPREAQIRSWML